MPKTKSKLSLSKRREKAFECFAKGYTNRETAKEIGVHVDSVAGYRERYNAQIHAQAAANPNFLREVVENTMRSLEELDRIRMDAWKHMEPRKTRIQVECPECEHEFVIVERMEVGDDTRSKYMGHLLKAQEMRAKLLGVMGVKQDVFVAIMQVKVVADNLMKFMGEELCADDKDKLAEFLMTPELRQYMQNGNVLEIIDADVIEERELEPARS